MRWTLLIVATLLSGCSLPRWPVEGPMTSPFGLRLDGFWPEVHSGVDISVPDGTPIRAMAAGHVEHAGWMTGYGHTVLLRHGTRIVSLYAHLSEVSVRAGEEVEGQAVIGLSGRSGDVTGPHLHFEVRLRGRPVDPVALLGRAPSGGRR